MNAYRQIGGRAILDTWGGRICDLPGYHLDALAREREAYLGVRARYDRKRWPRRTKEEASQ
jgi:hypothetical protein